ncbi:hypothetical protein IU427_25410 [Nocardia beijingensis]|uniref:hypothetical protein n=1 Tax=Nocardia beijingensis TaxID=95162 RepID=UPI0018947305|nr:hypothetical protein [Nocardia beijingensis]MBF6468483.1 hypothetical protein [Nocardia beijingensis]
MSPRSQGVVLGGATHPPQAEITALRGSGCVAGGNSDERTGRGGEVTGALPGALL